MVSYRVFFKKSVAKDLRGIPKEDVTKILDRIRLLGDNPRPPESEKLTGQERYQIRQGHHRIIYSVQDEEVTVWVVKVGHRKDVYR